MVGLFFGFLVFWLFGFLAFWFFGFLAFWFFGFSACAGHAGGPGTQIGKHSSAHTSFA
ncbi:hypothetical protein [Caballeronia udeis]|uniref:hypothetical protein n=1 Tax=Caballeronia udeis TaxID=1232866 RepID=UPI0012E8988A|nr:hypothetical protein [Caballeronia udeis]